MVFVGYEDGSKAYRVYDPVAHKLHVMRDVIFDESKPWSWQLASVDATMTTTLAGPSSFTVEYEVFAPNGEVSDDGVQQGMASPATPQTLDASSTLVLAAPMGPVFVTPPSGESRDSEGAPIRYRKTWKSKANSLFRLN
ncbi:hypothetical protein GUJ93_ZPchr0008g13412 [Zizania palustris]|uniref:Retroviral polymerase SH3-like domain-containing protein n=1 Tax=Zizania palustris TaxID=103762 RepID=A0A8J5RZ34_ZIZPA|nr:hypothetical protein GUJ93_ZPchr0008g13412 [Zizania palustris]